MIKKTHILLSTDLAELRERVVQNIMEQGDCYLSEDEIPDGYVEDMVNELRWQDRKELIAAIESSTGGGHLLLTGYRKSSWKPTAAAGVIFKNASEMISVLSYSYEHLKITDENGHLMIEGSDHDGTTYFEARVITARGQNYLNNQIEKNALSERKIHSTLKGNSNYTVLPHVASRAYGY